MWVKFYYQNDDYFRQQYTDNKEAFNQYRDIKDFMSDLPQLKKSWENYLEVMLEKILPKKECSWELIRDKVAGGKRNWNSIELFVMDYKNRECVISSLTKFFTTADTGMGADDWSWVDKESLYKKEIGGDLELLGIYTKLYGSANTILVDKERNYYLYPIERIEWLDNTDK